MIKLMPHQVKVLDTVKGFNRCAFYLDMGLGKTFVGSEKLMELELPVNNQKDLLICQKSKIKDWLDHFEKYYKHKISAYDLTKKKSWNEYFDNPNGYKRQIGIINYELAWRRPKINDLSDFTLMLDESSLIQNLRAKRTKFIMKLHPENVILLSGTPSSGKYENLVSQCNLLGWDISEHTYNNQYVNWKKIEVGGINISVVDKNDPYKNVDRLKRKLGEHGAVLMKTEEVLTLPEQVDIPIMVPKSKEYKRFTRDLIIEIDDKKFVGDTTLTKRLYQRMLCGQYSKEKLDAFEDLLHSTNDRLIVFYNFNEELDVLKALCRREMKTIGVISGSRKDEVTNQDVLLIQYQAGSMGLNLQDFGNKIVYFTLPERSELFEQSRKRIHRIGQNKTCFYYFLLVENSIETNEVLPTLKIRRDWNDELFV